jgi:geranylgeranyl reductase family protein
VIRCDALIVGGGPGGSTCARELRKAGWDVVVADRARFPRDKVCAGWLTPRVFELLQLDPAEYRAQGLTLQEIRGFRTGVIGRGLIETRYAKVVSYAIRRCEFDDFLLRRAGVRVLEGTSIGTIRRNGTTWIVNDEIAAPVIVGAGGHFCPVARHMRGGADTSRPVVAKEAEFRLTRRGSRLDADTPELFFCRDLEGYAWCVQKGEYLNVGIGRRENRDFSSHVKSFIAFLEDRYGVSPPSDAKWRGHAYLASGTGPRPLVDDGMLLVGDAAGLAYPESGEGISPAIESGRMAAHALIAAHGAFGREGLRPYADALSRLYPPASISPAPIRAAIAAVGRMLLGSRAFTRRIVLDRWFLRTNSRESSSAPPFKASLGAAAAHSQSPRPS